MHTWNKYIRFCICGVEMIRVCTYIYIQRERLSIMFKWARKDVCKDGCWSPSFDPSYIYVDHQIELSVDTVQCNKTTRTFFPQTPGRRKGTASRKILGERNVSVASSLPHDESFLSVANLSMASAGSYTDFQVVTTAGEGEPVDWWFIIHTPLICSILWRHRMCVPSPNA